jgi:hypothetical protein
MTDIHSMIDPAHQGRLNMPFDKFEGLQMRIWILAILSVSFALSVSEARTCGEGLLSPAKWASDNSPLFARIDKMMGASEYKTVSDEQNYTVEGYCAYKTLNGKNESSESEVIKPAFVLKRAERIALFVANSYDQFSDSLPVCQGRVEQLREKANQALSSDAMFFAKKNGVFRAEAVDKSWSMEQELRSNTSALVIKAKASNQSWHALLNCHFFL